MTMSVAKRNRRHSSHLRSIDVIINALEVELAYIDDEMELHIRTYFKALPDKPGTIKDIGSITNYSRMTGRGS